MCYILMTKHLEVGYRLRVPRNILQLAKELQPALQRPTKASRSITGYSASEVTNTQHDNYKDIVLKIVLNIKKSTPQP